MSAFPLRTTKESRRIDRRMVQRSTFFMLLFFGLSLSGTDPACSQDIPAKQKIVSIFSGRVPREWGESVTGVKTRLQTDRNEVALTFDACGTATGSGYDAPLIAFLEKGKIPAALFVSGSWIDHNPVTFRLLGKHPLFDVENHGLNHKPCSVSGRAAYGIRGTGSVAELIDEIEENGKKIRALTGRKPKFYRPGTAYCDEIGVEVANALGYTVVNFSVRGDGGATYNRAQVKKALVLAEPGSIILLHMNHPEGKTAEGLMEALPEMTQRGVCFVRLSEFPLR